MRNSSTWGSDVTIHYLSIVMCIRECFVLYKIDVECCGLIRFGWDKLLEFGIQLRHEWTIWLVFCKAMYRG